MTDDSFLQAIADNPNDPGLRLAYAGWLENHGSQPRAEAVRVCEAMRQVPVFDDAYWRLKRDRTELLATCAGHWLAATGYDGSRYDPLYRDGLPPDWKARWRLIREVTERWYDIPMADVGGRADDVEATELRLARQLPPSVREYIAYAHDAALPGQFGIVHRDVYTMWPLDGHPALSVMRIGEGNVQWAIHYDDLDQPDPPIYAYVWPPRDCTRYVPAEGGQPEAKTLTEFVLGFVTAYKHHAGWFATQVLDERELRAQLGTAFPIRITGRELAIYGFADDNGVTYEGEGILASLSHIRHESGSRLGVCVHKSVNWQRVPSFLWPHARQSHSRGGMFLSEEDRRSVREQWGDEPLRAWLAPAPPPLQDWTEQ